MKKKYVHTWQDSLKIWDIVYHKKQMVKLKVLRLNKIVHEDWTEEVRDVLCDVVKDKSMFWPTWRYSDIVKEFDDSLRKEYIHNQINEANKWIEYNKKCITEALQRIEKMERELLELN